MAANESDQTLSLADVVTQVQRDEPSPSDPLAPKTKADTNTEADTDAEIHDEPQQETRPHKDSLSIQTTRKRSWFSRIFCCMCDSDKETVVYTPPVPTSSFSKPTYAAAQQSMNMGSQAQGNAGSHSANNTFSRQNRMPSSSEIPKEPVALLPPLDPLVPFRKTLVLDLDETLVHSSFKPVPTANFVVQIEIDRTIHNVYVAKRPYVDEFLRRMGELYEVVVFTASLGKYANPVLDLLDIHGVVKYRLFRESCTNHMGNFVKDMSRIGRDPKHSMIVDNSPIAYLFQRESAIAITSWFDDPDDRELLEMIPFLESITEVEDVRPYLEDRH
eukprot:TRINITY_DN10577_c0_g1_i1.p1 TRINITY_DN10577_c0_g1~~TRINITY_DN10577_c0_g1_i1.p1  ORF type:complete len:330 (-),score=77.95 TRINITY_DN10577_c0_g1_i1:792-1781(-)